MDKAADKKYSEISLAPSWTSERLYADGDSYFSSLLEGIGASRLSIDLESYIFRDDRLGKRMETALCSAAARGVQVRVLVDGFGSQGWTFGMGRRLRESGIRVKIYHQLPWSVWF
jgi:cardiolipin synthase